jgi:hypothetical protein
MDSFYLKLNGDLMAVKGDSLFVKETDEMENIVIVKYRCGNLHAARERRS